MSTKTCTRCGTMKSLDQFGTSKVNKDGRTSQCRPCRTKIQRERRANDPDYAERQRDAVRRRRAEGRRAPSEALRGRKQRTAEEIEASARRRRALGRIAAARHQATRFGAPVNDFTLDDWYQLVEEHGGRCAYCGIEAKLVTEHVVPLGRGGCNTRDNVVPACAPCNRRKSKRSADNFRQGLCEAGHPRSGENVYTYPDGVKTACKPCRRIAQANSRARKKEHDG